MTGVCQRAVSGLCSRMPRRSPVRRPLKLPGRSALSDRARDGFHGDYISGGPGFAGMGVEGIEP
jgi:hypothetical protein